MSHWRKVLVALLCAGALLYFDSKDKGVTNHARNNSKFSSDSDIRVRIGNGSLRSICFVAAKGKRKRVMCPDCQKWVRDVGAKTYSCKDSKIKRGFVFTHRGRA
jgi:hypothetical protein